MKEINELMTNLLESIAKHPNASIIANHLYDIKGEASYKAIYTKLEKLGLFNDTESADLVRKAGFLLSGSHKVLKDYIKLQPGEFDAVQFKYDISNQFKERLKIILSNEKQESDVVPLESSVSNAQEQSSELEEISIGKKRALGVTEDSSSPIESHVFKVKQQRVSDMAVEFILGNKRIAEEFKNSYGSQAYNDLESIRTEKV